MSLTVNLIGPFEVHRGRRHLAVPTGKPRTLLALLLLERERVIARDQMIAELWPVSAPRSAQANLRSYLTTVRGWLRHAMPEAGLRLDCRVDGWMLGFHRMPLRLDAAYFQQQTAAADVARRSGQPAVACRHLRLAVHCWRGAPLQDVAQGPALTAQAKVLAAQWMRAVEQYAELLLEAGDFALARTLLHRFVSRFPGRERAWELLMLACYREGDVAATVATFGEARAALVNGLGVEPGRQLSERYRRLLSREP